MSQQTNPKFQFRKATPEDAAAIWALLQQAISRRRQDGSTQWQDGYPNEGVVQQDLAKGIGYVLTAAQTIAAYAAILFNDEPAYDALQGEWLSHGDFVVLHRIAVSDEFIGRGLAQQILLHAETIARKNRVFSMKVDTNFDNIPMLRTFEKMGYVYCGEVEFRGAKRKAFEKILLR